MTSVGLSLLVPAWSSGEGNSSSSPLIGCSCISSLPLVSGWPSETLDCSQSFVQSLLLKFLSLPFCLESPVSSTSSAMLRSQVPETGSSSSSKPTSGAFMTSIKRLQMVSWNVLYYFFCVILESEPDHLLNNKRGCVVVQIDSRSTWFSFQVHVVTSLRLVENA